MSSRQHGSEEALAALALGRLAKARRDARGRKVGAPSPTVLMGGLGLGFTLRAALDRLPEGSRVVVAELFAPLVEWNRRHVAHLAGRPLDDPRTRLQQGDVLARIAEAKGAFDAILLDVDNGPSPLAHPANERLYGPKGVRACRDALRAGGVLAVWSAGPDERYRERLERAGLAAEVETVAARSGTSKGLRHVVFLGVKPDAAARAPRGA
jgi:spermidine synthase